MKQDIITQLKKDNSEITADVLAIFCFEYYTLVTGDPDDDKYEEGDFPKEFYDLMNYFKISLTNFQENWNYNFDE